MIRRMSMRKLEEFIVRTELNVTQQTQLIERLTTRGQNIDKAEEFLAGLIQSLSNLYARRQHVLEPAEVRTVFACALLGVAR